MRNINILRQRVSLSAFDTVTFLKARACSYLRTLLGSCYIAVTRGGALLAKTQVLSEIEKLVASPALHGSESLCKLLRYLANHALEHPGSPLKEYQIATEVFARQSDFDPQLDSMVRVQAGRLRSKLTEHYNAAGAADPIWVELPKGTYVLAFHERQAYSGATYPGKNLEPPSDGRHDGLSEVTSSSGNVSRNWVLAVGALSILLTAAITVAVMQSIFRKPALPATVSASESASQTFFIFWKGFLGGPEQPLVIFSNARFVGRPSDGMRYYDAARDSGATILDHYTGVGEVLAVHDLDEVFAALHQPLRIKRGSLFSLDDAKNNDLIFIGSPAENLALLEIPSTKQFMFQRVTSGPREGDTKLVIVHPRAGEQAEYFATVSSQPLAEDYALVALVPGLNPARSELILAGTTTLGTQAAVEFVCSENLLQDLMRRLHVSQPGGLKPFEAIIRVKVARGVPVESDIVALRGETTPQ
jgi:hypothetical protein